MTERGRSTDFDFLFGTWRVLLAYAALIAAVVVAFVRLHEEPTLRRRYGDVYDEYCARVPAWRPRRSRHL